MNPADVHTALESGIGLYEPPADTTAAATAATATTTATTTWDSMAPVGAEFGSPDDERLTELGHLAFMTTGSLEAARVWRHTPNPGLDGMTPEDCASTASGLERVRALLQARPLPNPSDTSPTRMYTVKARWDSDAGVWVASSDDVPGLVTEAASWDALAAKLVSLVPELLTLNGRIQEGTTVRIDLLRAVT